MSLVRVASSGPPRCAAASSGRSLSCSSVTAGTVAGWMAARRSHLDRGCAPDARASSAAAGPAAARTRSWPRASAPCGTRHADRPPSADARGAGRLPLRPRRAGYRIAVYPAAPVKVSVASDMDTPCARALLDELRKRGHEPIAHGALAEGERARLGLGVRARRARRGRGRGRAGHRVLLDGHRRLDRREQGRRACAPRSARTPRPRAARARGTTRTCSRSACAPPPQPVLEEILDGWFATGPSDDPADRANIDHVAELDLERARG